VSNPAVRRFFSISPRSRPNGPPTLRLLLVDGIRLPLFPKGLIHSETGLRWFEERVSVKI